MNDHQQYGKFRAKLGKGADKALVIVAVDAYGSISWEVVSEQEFNAATWGELPPDLFKEVSETFELLNFSDDDIADERV